MFISKEDLRKPASSKRQPSTTSSGTAVPSGNKRGGGSKGEVKAGREEIAEKARQERFHRQELREKAAVATKLQAFWRGHRARWLFLSSLSLTLKRKLDDVEKVGQLLRSQGVTQPFVPPAAICVSLLRSFMMLKRLSRLSQAAVAERLWLIIVLPSAQKNLLEDLPISLIVPYLLYLLTNISSLLERGSVESLAGTLLRMYEGSAGMARALVEGGLFRAIYEHFSEIGSKIKLLKEVNNFAQLRSLHSTGVGAVWQLVCALVRHKVISSVEYCRLWTIPGLAASLEGISGDLPSLPWSCDQILGLEMGNGLFAGHWLLGNLCQFMVLLVERNQSPDRDKIKSLLQLITSLLMSYPVPGLLSGSEGVLWQTQGACFTASAVPAALACQAHQGLYRFSLIVYLMEIAAGRGIARREFNVAEEAWQRWELPADQEEVREAITHASALQMVQQALKHQRVKQAEQESLTGYLMAGLRGLWTNFSSLKGKKKSISSSSHSLANQAATLEQMVLPTVQQDGLTEAAIALWLVLFAAAAHSGAAVHGGRPWQALIAFTFSTSLPSYLLLCLLEREVKRGGLDGMIKVFDPKEHLVGLLSVGVQADQQTYSVSFTYLYLFLITLSVQLLVSEDDRLPLHLPLLLQLLRLCREMLGRILAEMPTLFEVAQSLHYHQSSTNRIDSDFLAACLVRTLQTVVGDCYSRWSRRPFSQPSLFTLTCCSSASFQKELLGLADPSLSSQVSSKVTMMLTHLSFSIPFHSRLLLLRRILDNDRPARNRPASKILVIRRSRLLEDSLFALSSSKMTGRMWRERFMIRFINVEGGEEIGIDSGGLFKEWIVLAVQEIFGSARGLFASTTEGLIYPHPAAFRQRSFHGDNDLVEELYLFAGRLLAKALIEDISLDLQFASFFLSSLRQTRDFHLANPVAELASLDPQLARGLRYLKDAQDESQVEDLGLTFSVTEEFEDEGGDIHKIVEDSRKKEARKDVELLPGGANMAVTLHNRFRYINLVAKYYLYDRIAAQSRAFVR